MHAGAVGLMWIRMNCLCLQAVLLVVASGYCVTRSDFGPYRQQVIIVPSAVLITGWVSAGERTRQHACPPAAWGVRARMHACMHATRHRCRAVWTAAPPCLQQHATGAPDSSALLRRTGFGAFAPLHPLGGVPGLPTAPVSDSSPSAPAGPPPHTAQITDFTFFGIMSTPGADEYDLSTMTTLAATIWFICSVLNLAALILAWMYCFEMLGREQATLEEEYQVWGGGLAHT